MAAEKFKDKIIKVFGMETDNEDGYDEIYDDDVYEEDKVENQSTAYTAPKTKRTATQTQRSEPIYNDGPEVLVLEPEVFKDAPGICNKIRANKTVVLNLKNTDYENGRKIFDFLSGSLFALDGSINKIADNVFILAPKAVAVLTNPAKDDVEFNAPILEWEEVEE